MKKSIILICLLTHTQINTKNFAALSGMLYRNYKAMPCTNQSLQKKFDKMQDKLGIKPRIPLFETEKLKRASACYIPNQAILVNKIIWPQLSPIEQNQTLYHELRHHLQNTNLLILRTFTAIKHYNLSPCQATEWDADQFGTIHAAKQCRRCYQELSKSMYQRNPARTKGYFNKKDCNELMKYLCKKNKPCNRHSK